MADMEMKLSIQPLEELLAERDHLIRKVCDLRARYGPFGTFDHLRKIELSRIAGLVRIQAVRDGVKMTENAIQDAAHAHPDYVEFVTLATHQRAEWTKLEALIEGIDMTINRGQVVARFATAEARLGG